MERRHKLLKEISDRHKRRLRNIQKQELSKRFRCEDSSNHLSLAGSKSPSKNQENFDHVILETPNVIEPNVIESNIDNNNGFETPYETPIVGARCQGSAVFTQSSSDSQFVWKIPDRSNEAQQKDNADLLEKLRVWSVTYNITHCALSKLLQILKETSPELNISDARTLLHTPRKVPIEKIDSGSYCHIGIEVGIKLSLKKYYPNDIPSKITYDVNIDGLPVSKSSGSQFWPILGSVKDSFYTEPFTIGIFHGNTKPEDPNKFLKKFVNEAKELIERGIIYNDRKIEVVLGCIICDAPAKAYITITKNHSGYFGCSKCIQEGDYVEDHVTFPETNNALRTDESFRLQLQEEHHKGVSILTELKIGMVSQIPLDYMHLVCLGVMKKLLQFWIRGKADLRMSKPNLEALEQEFLSLKSCIPMEFARSPRTFHELERWKATEFRQFLLYTGPCILSGILPRDKYLHFLTLCSAIRILCRKSLPEVHNQYAKKLLLHFVQNYSALYGAKNMSYNVHNLIHLADDVKLHGSLDDFSAFKYENFMYAIKKKLKTTSRPLEQIYNRLTEESYIVNLTAKSTIARTKLNTVLFKDCRITEKEPNNMVKLRSGQIMSIDRISQGNNVHIFGKIYETKNIFNVPLESKLIGIEEMTENFIGNREIQIEEILSKCMVLKTKDSQRICIELIHGHQ